MKRMASSAVSSPAELDCRKLARELMANWSTRLEECAHAMHTCRRLVLTCAVLKSNSIQVCLLIIRGDSTCYVGALRSLCTAPVVSFSPTSPGQINQTSLVAAAVREVAVPASQKIPLLLAGVATCCSIATTSVSAGRSTAGTRNSPC